MRRLRPGPDGEPLPSGEWVIRLAALPKDFPETGKVNEAVFELSTEDKNERNPRLSVWASGLTTERQAWVLTGSKPKLELVVRLNVDEVRALRPSADAPQTPTLDVQWAPLEMSDADGKPIPDTRAGAEGHAGVSGLHREPGESRLRTKSLRHELTKIAKAERIDLLSEPRED
jgi:hypothetical protein